MPNFELQLLPAWRNLLEGKWFFVLFFKKLPNLASNNYPSKEPLDWVFEIQLYYALNKKEWE